MKKSFRARNKILLSLGIVAITLAALPMFAAFEAHVINVTATIENALNVPIKSLDFGTVFPQEKFDKTFTVALSQSFRDAGRVDDVEYVIRQKPKCQATNPQNPTQFAQVSESPEREWICPSGYEVMPLLCPYLSKSETSTDGLRDENDMQIRGPVSAFHGPIELANWTLQALLAYEIDGRLAKSEQDFDDEWLIDLKVPCFGNHCAQDWEDFFLQNGGADNGHTAQDAASYIQPIENEHQLFGCDLWLEVRGISLPGIGCNPQADVMLVLDRSGSITGGEITSLETAAHAFVTALAPSASGIHMGQSSFATTGSLDQELADDGSLVDTAINNLSYGGSTNLFEGIDYAHTELDGSPRDRADGTSPDIMVIITDGNTNEPGTEANARAVAAAEAAAARANDIEIYVIGVGADVDATYLINNIATDPAHYFAAADFDELEAILEAIANCEEAPSTTGTLTVNKVVDGGSAGEDNFPLFVDAIEVDNGDPTAFPASDYTVSETNLPGYTAVFSGDCDLISGNVTIVAGGTYTCTITNTWDPQPTVFFSDGFGTGDDLNDIPNWEEEGNDNDSSTLAKEPTVSGEDSASPDGGRFAKIDDGEWICRDIDASFYEDLSLGYYWRGDPDAQDGEAGVAEFQIGTTCDSGTFTNIATHELDDGDNDINEGWSTLQSIALLGSLDNTIFALRFSNNAVAIPSIEEFRVDGVTVTGTPN